MKSSIFSSLALALMVLAMALWLRANRPPLDISPANLPIRWIPEDLGKLGDRRARIAGAWRLEAGDRRVGGFSGLAVDHGRLLGLTDGAMLVWLPIPPFAGAGVIRPLPVVAGDPRTKIGRDSEALARAGDGWWVAFEQKHQLIRYDGDFHRAVQRVPIKGRGFRANRGIEALSAAQRLVAYPERTGISDSAAMADGRVVFLKRRFGILGFQSSIAGLDGAAIGLPLARLDNPEGLAAQSMPGGGTRLWVITDNDQRRWKRTLLMAIDFPTAGGG